MLGCEANMPTNTVATKRNLPNHIQRVCGHRLRGDRAHSLDAEGRRARHVIHPDSNMCRQGISGSRCRLWPKGMRRVRDRGVFLWSSYRRFFECNAKTGTIKKAACDLPHFDPSVG